MKQTLYIIGFVGRSGSSYLEGLINSHPEAQCLGELFCSNGQYVSSGLPLSDFLRDIHSVDRQASGFKLALIHLRQFPRLRSIMLTEGYKVIISRRDNKVNQYISMRLAQINGSWRSDMGSFKQHSFVADPKHMKRFLHKFANDDAGVLKFVAELQQLVIPYEEITHANTHEKISSFLGLSSTLMESIYTRQRQNTSQRDALENYDELAEYFSRTRWSSHFVDGDG